MRAIAVKWPGSLEVTFFSDTTVNHGSKDLWWKFTKKWTKKTSSSYSSELGWRLKVKTTIESGELQSAVAKWQLEFESEAHGKYIYTTSEEKTEEITYERHFTVILALFIHLYNHLHAIQHLLLVTNISNHAE